MSSIIGPGFASMIAHWWEIPSLDSPNSGSVVSQSHAKDAPCFGPDAIDVERDPKYCNLG